MLAGVLAAILAATFFVPIAPCSLCRSEEVVVTVDQATGVVVMTCPCCHGRRWMTAFAGCRSTLAGDDPNRWR